MSILSSPAFSGFLQRHARTDHVPVAVFDCDGTVIKGDVGESMFYHQIENFLFKTSPAFLWPDHPENRILERLFSTLSTLPETKRRESREFSHFAELLLDWYFGQIERGRVAKACTDIVRLFSGFSLPEVRAIASQSFATELRSPLTERTLGSRTLPRGIRYIRESVEMIRALQGLGFAIWVVSGSNKWSVEPVFERLGIPAHQVIGIEMDDQQGVLTSKEVLPIPIRQDKVAAFQRKNAIPPILVATDSKNDIPLLLLSTDLKVRVNSRGRDTDDFFRTVGTLPDSSWVLVESPTLIDDGAV